MTDKTKMPDSESKELLEEYYKSQKYKESLIEERKRIDENYNNMYLKYLEGVNKVNELKYTNAPIEEEIKKNDNLMQENDKQMKTFLTDGEHLKTIVENLNEINKTHCKNFVETMTKIYEKMRELPETFTNNSVKNATKEAENRLRELTELKEFLIIKINKSKQEIDTLDDYEVPSNINESSEQINMINTTRFGDITKNTSTIADLQKNINTLKKKISEVESIQNI